MVSGLETLQQGSNVSHLSWKENDDLFKPSSCQTWKTMLNSQALTVLTVTPVETSTFPDRGVKLLKPFTEIHMGKSVFQVLAMLKAMQGFRLQAASNFKTEAEHYFFQHSFYLKVTSLLSSNSQKPSPKAKRSVVSSVCKAKFNWDLGRTKMLQEMVELVKTVNTETRQCFP